MVAIMKVLYSFHFEADLASDGNEAFQLVKRRYERHRKTYKLIVMDYTMPICTGVESTIKIR